MILFELTVFAIGFLWFWLRTDLEAEEDGQKRPRLRTGGRLDPR
jgi:hypothetical protein